MITMVENCEAVLVLIGVWHLAGAARKLPHLVFNALTLMVCILMWWFALWRKEGSGWALWIIWQVAAVGHAYTRQRLDT